MSSWVVNPGRPPYMIPCGSVGLKKNASSKVLPEVSTVVSSANLVYVAFKLLLLMSLTYMRNRIGPRIDQILT